MLFSFSANPLQRLVVLRWIEILTSSAALLFVGGTLELKLPFAALWGIVFALILLNVASLGRLTTIGEPGSRELLLQLALDLIALAGLLYFTGGSVNPFVSLLLLPLTIGAMLLSPIDIGLLTLLAFAAYALLLFFNVPLPPPSETLAGFDEYLLTLTGVAKGHEAHLSGHGFGLHILGMLLNFVLSALLITLFVSRMAQALRRRDALLAATREQALRHEQVLALGTLAAGAAHQLGTPLTTLAVVLHELRLAHADKKELATDLVLMENQVNNCKNILSEMLSAAGQERREGGSLLPLAELVNHCLDQWQLLRPAARCTLTDAPFQADGRPQIFADRTLEQAILNLLDNAADASPSGIEVRYAWNDAQCLIEIHDDGPGIDAALAERLSKNVIRSGKGGLGIGLFLSNATIERFGGKVELLPREPRGTCTRITLPAVSPAVNGSLHQKN